MDLLSIFNSKPLYFLVGISLAIIFGICIFFCKRAITRARELNITQDKINSVIRSSVIFSIVPSISIIIGLITLAPILGVPWSWFRLSVVGSLPYELTAADLSVKGAGFEGFDDFLLHGTPKVIGAIMFVMSISIMAGMVFNIFALKRVHTGVLKAGEQDTPFVDLALSVLVIGMMSVFVPVQSVKSTIHLLTIIVSMLITVICTKLAEKYNITWLNDFTMSFALIGAMAASVIFTNMGIGG
ncbi:DUF5058 domain-containing protein [Dolosicoccus paucivorans]|uniref:DUF5058 family protein n=1 Tax=Dolosicoccus paucivorans TaxID=84521 RepID=UPI000C8037CA|nr:DUF5058 family protein [Dolosicoccus paucivorans]PMB83778.1 DUF5058 domain-containing protein [Dolosicoccus paucivorans]